jgi:hypothetical protein
MGGRESDGEDELEDIKTRRGVVQLVVLVLQRPKEAHNLLKHAI